MFNQSLLLVTGRPRIILRIQGNVTNYDAFAAAGSPTYAAIINVRIEANVTVSSDGSGPALTIEGFDPGSEYVLSVGIGAEINGHAGSGGAGGSVQVDDNEGFVFGTATFGQPGTDGGDAIRCDSSIVIQNDGFIRGGGGGGGGGGPYESGGFGIPGSGGGGGQGDIPGLGGAGGISVRNSVSQPNAPNGQNGTTITEGSGGAAGAPGGNGGAYGVAGAAGSSPSPSAVNLVTGGAGGVAGFAVRCTTGSAQISGVGATVGSVS